MDEEKRQEEIQKIYCRFLFSPNAPIFLGYVSLKLREISIFFDHFPQPNHPEFIAGNWWRFRMRENDIRGVFELI